jgi:hypothetical protein
MRLAAGGTPAAVKRRVVNSLNELKSSLYSLSVVRNSEGPKRRERLGQQDVVRTIILKLTFKKRI